MRQNGCLEAAYNAFRLTASITIKILIRTELFDHLLPSFLGVLQVRHALEMIAFHHLEYWEVTVVNFQT